MIPKQIKGLSLSRPWPWAFEHPETPKRIENRTLARPNWVDWVALHAAKSWDAKGLKYIQRSCPEIPAKNGDHPQSQIFAVCRIQDCLTYDPWSTSPDSIKKYVEPLKSQKMWVFGPYCWVITDLVMLKTPVPCSGARGLWDLPADVFEALQASYAEALGGPAVVKEPDPPEPVQLDFLDRYVQVPMARYMNGLN